MVKNNELSPQQAKFRVGDIVKFKLEKKEFEGKIEKGYTNSFLISFKSDDPAMMDKYHDKVIINNKKLKIIKKVPRTDDKKKNNAENEKSGKVKVTKIKSTTKDSSADKTKKSTKDTKK